MICARVIKIASVFKTSPRNTFAHEWTIFLVFACFRELAAGIAHPLNEPLRIGNDHTTAEPPPLIFPESVADPTTLRIINDLTSANKPPPRSPPIISPSNIPPKLLAEILHSNTGIGSNLNRTLTNLDILARLTNLTNSPADSSRQNYSVQTPSPRSTNRSGKSCADSNGGGGCSGGIGGEVSEPESPPELSEKIKASLEKEEDELIVEPTKSAAGFVIVVVVVSIMTYAALFVWRKLLEQRYGHREMLIDDDQFCHASNLYDFQLGSDREMT